MSRANVWGQQLGDTVEPFEHVGPRDGVRTDDEYSHRGSALVVTDMIRSLLAQATENKRFLVLRAGRDSVGAYEAARELVAHGALKLIGHGCRSLRAVTVWRLTRSGEEIATVLAEADEAELDAAIEAARVMVDEHNACASSTRLGLYVLKGRIAGTDEQAARAILSDARELIAEMDMAMGRMDVEAIREAASRALQLGSMLAPEQRAAITGAAEAARKAARQIVKRVEKGGEQAAVVLADLQRGAVERARLAFLDLDTPEPSPDSAPAAAVDAEQAAQLDLDVAAGGEAQAPTVIQAAEVQ